MQICKIRILVITLLRNPEKRVFLENKRVFLENKREPEKRVFLENKRVFLENKREAEKRVFLENKRGGLHNTHHHVFDEQPTHLRGFKDEHTAIQVWLSGWDEKQLDMK